MSGLDLICEVLKEKHGVQPRLIKGLRTRVLILNTLKDWTSVKEASEKTGIGFKSTRTRIQDLKHLLDNKNGKWRLIEELR